MLYNFIFRMVITMIIFIGLKLKNFSSLPILIIILFVLDELDSNFPTAHGFLKYTKTLTFEYQKYDKICDWLVYLVFLILFRNLFDNFTQKLLFFFLFWRLIGIIQFYRTGKTFYVKIFADFINSTLIAYAVYQYFSLKRSYYYLLIVLFMILKIGFEAVLHRRSNYE